ncbi:MAG TPA: hypothetical protein V6D06_13220 [Trichocoleus sp.]
MDNLKNRFYLVHGKKKGDTLHQWLISCHADEEEAAAMALKRSDVWVSTCQDWTAAELDEGYRSLAVVAIEQFARSLPELEIPPQQ